MAAGALAVGVSSALGAGGLGSPAVAQEPPARAEAFCQPEAFNQISVRFLGLPGTQEELQVFSYLHWGNTDVVLQDWEIHPDAAGQMTISYQNYLNVPPPITVRVAVYRELTGDETWNPDEDENLFVGRVTLTECGPTVPMSPK